MISNWILDISIGCLLLISIGYFYEKTVIFYTMFNWWIMIFLLPFVAVSSLVDRSREQLNEEAAPPIQAKYIEPIKPAEQYNFVNSIVLVLLWLVPIIVDLVFAIAAIFLANLLNINLNLGDIHIICLTPVTLLIVLYYPTKVYKTLSNSDYDIKHPIYDELGVIGVIANTFVIEWGGYSIAKILEI
jgi:H+/gluconate symporter-like permease